MKKSIVLFFLYFICCSPTLSAQCESNLNPFDFEINLLDVADSSIKINWPYFTGAAEYRFKLTNKKTNTVVMDSITSGNYMEVYNLNPKSLYKLNIFVLCSNGNQMANYFIDIRTLANKLVIADVAIDTVTKSTAKITWTKYGSFQYYIIRYRPAGQFLWKSVIVKRQKCVIRELIPSTNYEFQVAAYLTSVKTFSLPDSTYTFQTDSASVPATPKPNVLVIMMDDSRQNVYQPDGAPAWFETPGISRIANEGLRFVNAYVTQAICDPSRASIYTGLYPHRHGFLNESSKLLNDSLPTVASVLHQKGYYTGAVGKYGLNEIDPAKGFDYWYTTLCTEYFDQIHNINGYDTLVAGHRTDITNSAAMDFLNNKPANVPFLLFLNHRAPHAPFQPRHQDTALYSLDSISIASNFAHYDSLYPSYLYPNCEFSLTPGNEGIVSDSLDLLIKKRKYFQLIKGADDGITEILNYLDTTGQLNNTLVIFTSDNGYLLGEHYLAGKRLAYEESLRVPMYIRYPLWFAPGTVMNTQFASNIDIFPTILEAAGITFNYNLNGKSLNKVYNGSVKRNYFYYEYYRAANVPCIKAIRSPRYKYIRSYCDSLTEEFYDLQNDPKENVNLILKPAQQNRIAQYRFTMDSMILVLNDTTTSVEPCSLIGGYSMRLEAPEDHEAIRMMSVYPVPASDKLNVNYITPVTGKINLEIKDVSGKSLAVFYQNKTEENASCVIDISTYATGTYFLIYSDGSNTLTEKFVVEKK